MSRNRRSCTLEFKEEAERLAVETIHPVASVAREVQVNEQTLRNQVNEHRKVHAADEPQLTVPERAQLRDLEKEVRELRSENEFLGKPRPSSREGEIRLRSDLAADDPERTDERWSIGVDVGFVGCATHQSTKPIVREQKRPDLLFDQLW